MVVLPSTGASRYHNYFIDGGTSPEFFLYILVHVIQQVSLLCFKIEPKNQEGLHSVETRVVAPTPHKTVRMQPA
jgi:hypothetical protein